MARPRLLDLFSGAGGAAAGYQAAGFSVFGVDINPQPHYPFGFLQDDALVTLRLLLAGCRLTFNSDRSQNALTLADFDAIHASPPCQGYLNLTKLNESMGRESGHQMLIEETRNILLETGLPYVIENVQDARTQLLEPVRVCGTGLGMPLRRHRMFESSVPLVGVPCRHDRFTVPRYWTSWQPNGERRLSTVVQVYGNGGGKHEWAEAMGIDWMNWREMAEAIPPAYTGFIGAQLLASLEERAA